MLSEANMGNPNPGVTPGVPMMPVYNTIGFGHRLNIVSRKEMAYMKHVAFTGKG